MLASVTSNICGAVNIPHIMGLIRRTSLWIIGKHRCFHVIFICILHMYIFSDIFYVRERQVVLVVSHVWKSLLFQLSRSSSMCGESDWKLVQTCVGGYFDKSVWSPSWSDIKPMNVAIYPILESDDSRILYSSVTDLKETLLASFVRRYSEEIRQVIWEAIKGHDRANGSLM